MIKYRAAQAFLTLAALAWIGAIVWALFESFGWWGPLWIVGLIAFSSAFVWAIAAISSKERL